MNVPELDWKQRFLPASPWELTLKIDSNEAYHVWLWIYLFNLGFVTGKSTSHRSYTPTLMTTRIQLAGLINEESALNQPHRSLMKLPEHALYWQGKCSTCSNIEQTSCYSRSHSAPQILISPKTSHSWVVTYLFFSCPLSWTACITHVKIESE
jgi:hypothetical protein